VYLAVKAERLVRESVKSASRDEDPRHPRPVMKIRDIRVP
jgi:hypothetical protein